MEKATPLLDFDVILPNESNTRNIDLGLLFMSDIYRTSIPCEVYVECKSGNEFCDEDIERMRKIGIARPGSVLVFATLKPFSNLTLVSTMKKLGS